jgi:hypothetical protein
MARCGLLIVALACASPALAQQHGAASISHTYQSEPRLELGRTDFALPVVEYRAPDGTLKISQGIVVGRDVAPNARIGLGLFRMKPKYDEDSGLPAGGKSRKVALGLSLRF